MLQCLTFKRIQQTCAKYNLIGKGKFSENGLGLHIVKNFRLAYCANPKVVLFF